jgi:flagellar basal body P-ring formation protein FlgA
MNTRLRPFWPFPCPPTSFFLWVKPVCAMLLPLAVLTDTAQAQQDPHVLREAVLNLLQSHTQGLPGQVLIDVAPLDARNQLAPCSMLEPFLPQGTRPLGRISVGVRCQSPTPWTVYIQAHVQMQGRYLVFRQAMRAGEVIDASHLTQAEGDLGLLPDGALFDPAQAIGQSLRYSVSAHQPLRAEMLRAVHVIRSGQRVKVQVQGSGFSVSHEGQTLNGGAEGDRIRVRMPNNQVIEGQAQRDGSVRVLN